MSQWTPRRGPPAAAVARTLALILIVCLVQCATGSCLSYGHSCWGAHGKRSGKTPASAPDWYLTRILRMMVANGEMERSRANGGSNDIEAIYRPDTPDDSTENGKRLDSDEVSMETLGAKRNLEGIPMLDDDVLSKTKFWQMLKAASQDN